MRYFYQNLQFYKYICFKIASLVFFLKKIGSKIEKSDMLENDEIII